MSACPRSRAKLCQQARPTLRRATPSTIVGIALQWSQGYRGSTPSTRDSRRARWRLATDNGPHGSCARTHLALGKGTPEARAIDSRWTFRSASRGAEAPPQRLNPHSGSQRNLRFVLGHPPGPTGILLLIRRWSEVSNGCRMRVRNVGERRLPNGDSVGDCSRQWTCRGPGLSPRR